MNYLLRLAANHDSPISASQVARITVVSRWHLVLIGLLETFYFGTISSICE
jgi:hypothetical protein